MYIFIFVSTTGILVNTAIFLGKQNGSSMADAQNSRKMSTDLTQKMLNSLINIKLFDLTVLFWIGNTSLLSSCL